MDPFFDGFDPLLIHSKPATSNLPSSHDAIHSTNVFDWSSIGGGGGGGVSSNSIGQGPSDEATDQSQASDKPKDGKSSIQIDVVNDIGRGDEAFVGSGGLQGFGGGFG